MRFRPSILCCFLLSAALLGSTACSTLVDSHTAKKEMMGHYLAGEYSQIRGTLDDRLRPSSWYNDSVVGTGDEVMWRLEAGTMFFLLGDDEASIRHFEAAEERIEDFDSRARVNLREAGAETAVLVTNLNALPYRGCCRDRILLPVFKAFAYLGKKDEEGFRVELFRLRENQEKVLEDYRSFFEDEEQALQKARASNRTAAGGIRADKIFSLDDNEKMKEALKETGEVAHRGYGNFMNPFAIFLSGYGYIRDGDFQNAIVDFRRLRRAVPESVLAKQFLAFSLRRSGRNLPGNLRDVPEPSFPLERNTVLVVFANGRSASLRQVSLYLPVVFPGYASIAAVAWPVCEYYSAPYTGLTVRADGHEYGSETLADLDGIMAQEYQERLPGLIARTVLSTAVKEFGSYAATRAAAHANNWAGIAVGVTTTLYKMAVNTADTRSWEILPREIRVALCPVPENRTLVITPGGGSPIEARIPPDAESAIIYVNAPSRQSPPLCRIFPLHSH